MAIVPPVNRIPWVQHLARLPRVDRAAFMTVSPPRVWSWSFIDPLFRWGSLGIVLAVIGVLWLTLLPHSHDMLPFVIELPGASSEGVRTWSELVVWAVGVVASLSLAAVGWGVCGDRHQWAATRVEAERQHAARVVWDQLLYEPATCRVIDPRTQSAMDATPVELLRFVHQISSIGSQQSGSA